MAKVFRSFQMQKVGSHSCNSLGGHGDDSNSLKDFVRNPIRLFSHSRSRGHLTHGESRGDISDGEAESGLKRSASRKNTRKATAKQVVQDGVSKIRCRLRKLTKSPAVADSDHSPCDSPKSPKLHRGSSGSSCGSRTSRDAKEADCQDTSKSNSDKFKAEVKGSHHLAVFRDYIMGRTCNEDGAPDREVMSRWNEFFDIFISEAWRSAEQIVRAQWKKAEFMMEKSREAQKSCREAHSAYQKEVTALRDQLRDLPPGTDKVLKNVFFSPLQNHDEATRELVMACSEERVKTLLSETDKEDSVVGGHIRQKVEEKCAEIKQSEQRRMESLFQLERADLQRCISQLQGESERLRVDLDQARTASASAQNAIRSGDAQMEELESAARKSMAEAANLRKDLEQAHAEINCLTVQMEMASQAANDANRTPEELRKYVAETSAVTKETPSDAENATLRPAWPSESSSAAPRLAENAAPSAASSAVLRPAENAAPSPNAAPDGAESRPILPGASATVLMEHAVQLHEGLDSEKSDKTVPATDLLTVLERLGEQLEIEVRKEATDALPEAFEGSLVITLLAVHAQMARRHGTALLPIAILLLQSTAELSTLAQGKGTPQMKVLALSRHLVDLRSEACKLLSACFSCAHNAFQGLEGLRNRLRSSLQLDGRGSSATPSRGVAMSPVSDIIERELRTHTAPELPSLDLSDDQGRKTADSCSSSNGAPSSPTTGKGNAKNVSKGNRNSIPQINGLISMCDAVDLPLKQTVQMGASRGQVQTKGGNQINRRTFGTGSGSSGGIQRICSDTLEPVTPSVRGFKPPRSPAATTVVPQMAESVLVTNVNPNTPQGNSRQLRRKSIA